ncbi:hypothetical protein RHGRI_019797 [Rhododendron griersonianum]|uniref:Flotillin-like n=1 Tax=Rhododendron griersonianum TaxID=479676 RepID=A0AAV6JH04_9ERIC|nr:hypothetical protein RHGRI_019797 [Rhododendron griersonianum]
MQLPGIEPMRKALVASNLMLLNPLQIPPFILPAVFTIGPRIDSDEALLKFAKLISPHDKQSNHVVELVQGVIEGETRDLAASMTMEEIFKGTKEFKKELVDVPGHEYFSYLGQKTQMEAANQAREFIMTALAAKTVIFVTHQVEFLPAADMILVLKECLIVQAGKYDEILQAGTDFKALVSAHHEAIESMDIPNSSEDSDGSNPHDASIVFSKRCDSIGNNIVSLVKEVKEGLSAHKLATIKTAWLPSVLLADAYPLQFAYVCTQQMSFNQNTLILQDSDLVFVAVRNPDDFRLLVLGANGSKKMYN